MRGGAGFRRSLLACLLLVGMVGCELSKTVIEVVPVSGVAVSPPTVSLSVGAAQQMTATLKGAAGHTLGGRTISWSSSNGSVATVSQAGLVTGSGAGTATITATSEGRSGSATVTVPTYTLEVAKAGTGSGTVTSSPTGINCGSTCSVSYASGTLVTLTATAASGSVFGGWTGACTGSTCRVTMSAARSVAATFSTVELGVGFGSEQFALIPAGTFQMGSTNGYPDERPVHTVKITKAFYMQKTEVTQWQWRAVVGTNPSWFSSCGDTCPVEMVSWNDIQAFLAALNTQDPGKNYRLPTEAEWEYAARATTTEDYGGTGVLDEMGWYSGNSGSGTQPVAQKQPNHWGLFDMHGNVWEWVDDWYSDTYYSVSPTDDPQGPATGAHRVLRGGSWFSLARNARSANRNSDGLPSGRVYFLGFRLARTQ